MSQWKSLSQLLLAKMKVKLKKSLRIAIEHHQNYHELLENGADYPKG